MIAERVFNVRVLVSKSVSPSIVEYQKSPIQSLKKYRLVRMPLFDSYIFIDWSAANKAHSESPSANAPWVGELTLEDNFHTETYHRTRQSLCANDSETLTPFKISVGRVGDML